MSKPFDATLKELVQAHPRDWLALFGAPAGPVEALTPDLSTVSAFADVVLRVAGGLLHLDVQSGPDPDLSGRMLLYNVLVHDRYGEPVHTVLVLLHRRADRSDLTGTHRYELWPGRGGVTFQFQVIRIWDVPVETLLTAGVGVAPLAPLGRLPEGVTPREALPDVVRRLEERVVTEAPDDAETLLTAAFILTGLRLDKGQLRQLFQGVRAMRESSGYQIILDEGRTEGRAEGEVRGVRATIMRIGRRRFGPPGEVVESALQAITDLERLGRMSERVLDAADWQDLAATP